MNYRDEFFKEYPKIRPEFENDLEWLNKGMSLLRKGKLTKAESIFKKLVLSQPHHPDGLEGLAKTYKMIGNRAKSLMFINDAIEMTSKMVASGESDKEILLDMNELREEIIKMPK